MLSSLAWSSLAKGALVGVEYRSLLSTIVLWCNYHNYLGLKDRDKPLRMQWVVGKSSGISPQVSDTVSINYWSRWGLGGGDSLKEDCEEFIHSGHFYHWLHIWSYGTLILLNFWVGHDCMGPLRSSLGACCLSLIRKARAESKKYVALTWDKYCWVVAAWHGSGHMHRCEKLGKALRDGWGQRIQSST